MDNKKELRLYELPQRTEQGIKIYLREEEVASDGSTYIVFHHIDGMYSYCTTEHGNTCHLSAATPLEPFEDGYRFLLIE